MRARSFLLACLVPAALSGLQTDAHAQIYALERDLACDAWFLDAIFEEDPVDDAAALSSVGFEEFDESIEAEAGSFGSSTYSQANQYSFVDDAFGPNGAFDASGLAAGGLYVQGQGNISASSVLRARFTMTQAGTFSVDGDLFTDDQIPGQGSQDRPGIGIARFELTDLVTQTSLFALEAEFGVLDQVLLDGTNIALAPGNYEAVFSATVTDTTSGVEQINGSMTAASFDVQVSISGLGANPFSDSCNGDGGDQAGCTPCLCGNDSPPGFAGGCVNSSGTGARLSAAGATSILVLDGDDLRFTLEGGVPSSFAVLISGDNLAPANPMNPCFGLNSGLPSTVLDGLRCAVGNTQRHGGRPVAADGSVGATTNGWGGASGPAVGLAAQGGFVAGQTRHYQVFYRELPGLVCGTEQNTSQAVSVTFEP